MADTPDDMPVDASADDHKSGSTSVNNIANFGSNYGAQGLFYAPVTVNNFHAPLSLPDRVRRLMLQQVRTIWITDLLERSLYREVRLQIRLRTDPHKVDLPIRALVQEVGGMPEDLPAGVRIVEMFDRFDGALLILGAPGSGKTTLLLELARELLHRADTDPQHPLPVVFPLSTWTTRRKPIEQWLVDQLVMIYQVRRKLAASWVAEDLVLPLLDGLDEVAEAHRPACVQAINAFRNERGTLPLVVCSRLQEYQTIAQEAAILHLRGAVIVQTLHRAAVLDALFELGPAAVELRDMLTSTAHSWLWNVATNPLGLSMLIPAVQHDPTLLYAAGNDAERRNRIFHTYINAMFKRRGIPKRWPHQETIRLLSWLAVQMYRHRQTLFLLEGLQPDWLPQRWQQHLVRWSSAVVGGLIGTLCGALVGGFMFGFGSGLIGGLVGGLICGAMFGGTGGLEDRRIQPVERLGWSWAKARRAAPLVVVANLGLGLLVGLVVGLDGGFGIGAISGLVLALVGGLGSGLALSLEPQAITLRHRPNEGMIGSGYSALFGGVGVGLGIGLISGVGLGLIGWTIGGVNTGLSLGLSMALGIGVSCVLGIGLYIGGAAIIQHVTLRLLLVRTGFAPLRYAEFLDHAAERVLLRRVGGGWVFVHRLLLDYFVWLAPGLGIAPQTPSDEEVRAESRPDQK